jgi:hypothetical protein
LDGFRLVAADYEEPFPAGALAPLVGVTEVTGDIEMTMVDVRDLRALSCLRRVGGNLDIGLAPSCVSYGCWRYPFEALESFDGLENLREVGGVLGIHSTSIRETTPLAGLESAGGLDIQGTWS